ncbi:MAG: hypothetical protein V1768_01420 [Patescibacteria group bacterium]|nr:hypothetical protein [Patescibacteria group bacterium]MBU1160888.1 hypothetical protein [Patescibacteria group bacterium]MBU1421120.1 hypothetical protein [Patescibacteria group bacterium]MBU1684471.1 hypothetical protein [Patescibacteria group bacterium]MBU1778129.1 hypothetical protein [Patescibacteria group bacterium]
MKKIWDLKIRKSVQKEFPGDPMLQELHELRLRSPFSSLKSNLSKSLCLKKDLERVGLKLVKTQEGYMVQ